MKISMVVRNIDHNIQICPVVLCESCNQEIEAARSDGTDTEINPRFWGGILQWVDGQEPVASHKGECADIIENGWKKEGHILISWMPLDACMIYLLNSVTDNPEDTRQLAETLSTLG